MLHWQGRVPRPQGRRDLWPRVQGCPWPTIVWPQPSGCTRRFAQTPAFGEIDVQSDRIHPMLLCGRPTAALESLPCTHRLFNILCWDEVDPNQHMRHTVYLTYGAEGRMAVFAENGIDFTTDGGIGIAPVLFREEAIYRLGSNRSAN